MLEHHFWENFRKWVPHQDVDAVYDIEEIGFEKEGFVVLLRPDHFQKEKRSERALRLVWDRIIGFLVDNQVPVCPSYVAIGCSYRNSFSSHSFAAEHRSDFLAGVLGVPLIEQRLFGKGKDKQVETQYSCGFAAGWLPKS